MSETPEYGDTVYVRKGPRVVNGFHRRTFFAFTDTGEVVVFGGEQFPAEDVSVWPPLDVITSHGYLRSDGGYSRVTQRADGTLQIDPIE